MVVAVLLQFDWSKAELPVGNERLANLLWCIGIILATLLLKKPLALLLAKLFSIVANRFTEKKHGTLFSSLLRKPLELLLQTVLFYIAISQLNILLSKYVLEKYKDRNHILSIRFGDIADLLFLFFAIIFITLLLSRIADFIYRIQQDKAIEEQNKERQQLLPLLKDVAKLVLWSIGLFWMLGAVFQVNVPALITGLGIGGVAIALAAKESVENLFAAFTILSDKPFQTGDHIKTGVTEGIVERIGFRSTRLRSPEGSAYMVPNKKLVMEPLENLSLRSVRRVKTTVNIPYGISPDALQAMVQDMTASVSAAAHVSQPVEVFITTFPENVFQLDISYYLPVPLATGSNLNLINQNIRMLIYETLHRYAYPGTDNDKNRVKEQTTPNG